MGNESFVRWWAAGGPTAWFVLACWVIFLLYWLVSAFSVKRVAQRPGWRAYAWRLPILLALAAILLLARTGIARPLSHSLDARLWSPHLATGLVADALALAGLAVALWARRTLGGNWSAEVVIREGHELIERGPYARVRHPIYSGMILMVLGAAMLSGALAGFVLALALALGFWLKARQEERLLTRQFPEAYPAYMRRTKALIPGVL